MREHNKLGRIKPALDKKDLETVKKWVDSGITDQRRIEGKILLHFGVSYNTAKKYAKLAL